MPEILDLDVTSLQNATIAYLNKVSDSIALTIDKPEIEESKRSEYESDLQQIEAQIKSVNDLELKMVITAPMKAGKSTLLNALIGQEIMPVHSDAMTTLPTNVVLNSQLEEPVLKLSDKTFSAFQETISILQKQTPQWAQEIINTYPHLRNLLEAISKGLVLKPETKGRDDIYKTLENLNHIIRLSSQLVLNQDPFQSIPDFPRLETPFRKQKNLTNSGKFVIVDTPGPNEAGQSKLKDLVNTQLKETALVLVVVNYDTLRSKELAEIKEQVKEIIKLRGKKNLYVVVNKIDLRKGSSDKHLTSEQVREFVINEYEISGEQVFEVSAYWAFLGTNVLRVLENNPQISMENLRSMASTKHFAEEFYGLEWEDTFNEFTKEKLYTDAEKLWKKSGFSTLLEKVIGLLKGTEHSCMRKAMTIGSNSLNKLNNSWSNEMKQIKDLYYELADEVARSKDEHNDLRKNLNTASEKLAQQHGDWSIEIEEVRRLYRELIPS